MSLARYFIITFFLYLYAGSTEEKQKYCGKYNFIQIKNKIYTNKPTAD